MSGAQRLGGGGVLDLLVERRFLVPETVIWLLILGASLTLAMVGFHAGLQRHRSLISAVVLVIVLGAVITLVVDLDRPRDGFLPVSQQPLIDVQQQMGAPGG